jgi:hypothetical protein
MAIRWKPNLRPVDIDPDAKKDYTYDFEDYIPEGAAITSFSIVASGQVTVYNSTRDGTEITFWVRAVPEGVTVTVTVRVTLDTGLVDDFSLRFRGRDQ